MEAEVKTTTTETKTAEQLTQEKEAQEKWDKAKQRADQAEANFRKAVEDKTALAGQLEETRTMVEELEAELEAAKISKAELKALDPTLVDGGVIEHINKLKVELEDTKGRLKTMESLAETYEQERATRQEEERRSSARESILKPLDKKYGAKFRNEAIKLADKKVAENPIEETKGSPEAFIRTYTLLEECYQELVAKETEPPKKSVTTDTGGSSISLEGLSEGTFDEIVTQMKKEGKLGKGMTMPKSV